MADAWRRVKPGKRGRSGAGGGARGDVAPGGILSEEELARRARIIREAKKQYKGASLRLLSDVTGLSVKKIWYTLNLVKLRRQAERLVRMEKHGLCEGMPDTCGPCADCLGVCGVCKKPIKREQSYTKTVRSGREVKIHLECLE